MNVRSGREGSSDPRVRGLAARLGLLGFYGSVLFGIRALRSGVTGSDFKV
jgi:hypothetical protein